MNDFFEMPEPPAGFQMPQQRYRMPEWMGAPENVLPALVPVELTIGRSDEAIVHISGIRVFPVGWQFGLTTLIKPVDDGDPWMMDPMHSFHMQGPPKPGAPLPDELMRFGFEFADGAKVTNLDMFVSPFGEDGQPPSRPILQQGGGGGGGLRYDWNYWCWPLPSGDALKVICEWPARGIARTETTLDAGPIRDAATRAEELWPDDAPVHDFMAQQSAVETAIPRIELEPPESLL